MSNSDFFFINELLKDFSYYRKKAIFKFFCASIKNQYNQKHYTYFKAKTIINVSYYYLMYCDNFKIKMPTQKSLEGYLWINYSHKSYISYFISFLQKNHKCEIKIDSIKKPLLTRPKKSHKILKERVIYILENPNDKHLKEKYIIDALIGYFHWIHIPSNVYLSKKNFNIINKKYYCTIYQHNLYLPKILIEKFIVKV